MDTSSDQQSEAPALSLCHPQVSTSQPSHENSMLVHNPGHKHHSEALDGSDNISSVVTIVQGDGAISPEEKQKAERMEILEHSQYGWLEQTMAETFKAAMNRRIEEFLADDHLMQNYDPNQVATIQQSAIVIGEIRNAFIDDALCKICFRLMAAPFILSCGHAFCGPCLKNHFQARLQAAFRQFNLRDIGVQLNVGLGVLAASVVLASHGVNPQQVYQYPCPACRKEIRRRPILSTRMGDLGLALYKRLKDDEIEQIEVTNEGSADPFEYFALYFI